MQRTLKFAPTWGWISNACDFCTGTWDVQFQTMPTDCCSVATVFAKMRSNRIYATFKIKKKGESSSFFIAFQTNYILFPLLQI